MAKKISIRSGMGDVETRCGSTSSKKQLIYLFFFIIFISLCTS